MRPAAARLPRSRKPVPARRGQAPVPLGGRRVPGHVLRMYRRARSAQDGQARLRRGLRAHRSSLRQAARGLPRRRCLQPSAPHPARRPPSPGRPVPRPKDAPPDCRCPPTRHRAGQAPAGRLCRTNCRNAHETVASGPWSQASAPAGSAHRSRPASPCRGRRPSTADTGRYWWARSGERRQGAGFPENCREADNCRPR